MKVVIKSSFHFPTQTNDIAVPIMVDDAGPLNLDGRVCEKVTIVAVFTEGQNT